MDNERKMIHLDKQDAFVDELLANFKVDKVFAGNKYKVEEEFPKTRKNNASYFWRKMWRPLLITIGLILVTATGIFHVVKYQNDHIEVDVSVFEDLNLQSLLTEINDAKANYENQQKVLDALYTEWDKVKENLERNYEADLFVLEQMGLEDEEKIARQKEEIEETYHTALDSINNDYQQRINVQQEKLLAAKEKFESFQKNNADAYRRYEQSASLQTSQTLKEMQENQIKSNYESELSQIQEQISVIQQSDLQRQQQAISEITDKYKAQIDRLDPEIKEKSSRRIVENTKVDAKTENFLATRLSSSLPDDASEEFKKAFQNLRDEYERIQAVGATLSRAIDVEHKKDLPLYARTLSRLSIRAGNNFAEASMTEIQRHIGKEKDLQSQINSYSNYMMTLCRKDGFVINSDNPEKIEIFAAPDKSSFSGSAAILRNEEIVSVGNLVKEKGRLFFIPGSYYVADKNDVSSIRSAGSSPAFENKPVQLNDQLLFLNLTEASEEEEAYDAEVPEIEDSEKQQNVDENSDTAQPVNLKQLERSIPEH